MSIKKVFISIMAEANIFLCHNPFHFYISSQICKDKFASDQYENWIVTPLKNVSYDSRFHYILARNDFFGKLITLWRIKRRVKELAKKYEEKLHIFLPHTDGIIGNYVFESTFMKSKNVKIKIFYLKSLMDKYKITYKLIQICY
jgi:hypothetical protein